MSVPIWDRYPVQERLAINYTLTCNLACAHCNTDSNPHRRERLSPDDVRRVLAAGRDKGKRHVIFSGGEVFLFQAELLGLVREAVSLGYEVDVETNAFWARSQDKAIARLTPFVTAGVARYLPERQCVPYPLLPGRQDQSMPPGPPERSACWWRSISARPLTRPPTTRSGPRWTPLASLLSGTPCLIVVVVVIWWANRVSRKSMSCQQLRQPYHDGERHRGDLHLLRNSR